MNDKQSADWDRLIVKLSGIALITAALIWLPLALRGLFQFVSVVIYMTVSPVKDGEIQKLVDKMNISFLSTSLGNILTFVILVALARWVLSYPKIFRKAFQLTDNAFQHSEPPADPQDSQN